MKICVNCNKPYKIAFYCTIPFKDYLLKDLSQPEFAKGYLDATIAIGGEQEAVEYWQVKRDNTRRGIVEVIYNDSEQS